MFGVPDSRLPANQQSSGPSQAAASIGSLLGRMRELATQAASGTVGTTERSYLDQEFVALRSEIDRISTLGGMHEAHPLTLEVIVNLQKNCWDAM